LESPGSPVTEFDAKLEKLVADMFETMYAANGVGLAAPQIGLSLRLAVIDTTCGDDPGAKLVLVNPEVISTEGEHVQDEGCLSLPDFRAKTPRPARATVRARDINGKEYTMSGEGLLARAFCHEIDHLNGRLFITHVGRLKRESIKRKVRKMAKAGEW
jgi:peptide deformylase